MKTLILLSCLIVSVLGGAAKPARDARSACDSGPCQNGGQCIDITYPGGPLSFRCACREGFKGEICQKRIDLCEDEPCQNGGMCTQRGEHYHCMCPETYKGKNCETPVAKADPCSTKPCGMHGVCEIVSSQVVCECLHGYRGPKCDQSDAAAAAMVAPAAPVAAGAAAASSSTSSSSSDWSTWLFKDMLIAILFFVVLFAFILLCLCCHCYRVWNRRYALKSVQEARRASGKPPVPTMGWLELSNQMCYDCFCWCWKSDSSPASQDTLAVQDRHLADPDNITGVIVPVRDYNALMVKGYVQVSTNDGYRNDYFNGQGYTPPLSTPPYPPNGYPNGQASLAASQMAPQPVANIQPTANIIYSNEPAHVNYRPNYEPEPFPQPGNYDPNRSATLPLAGNPGIRQAAGPVDTRRTNKGPSVTFDNKVVQNPDRSLTIQENRSMTLPQQVAATGHFTGQFVPANRQDPRYVSNRPQPSPGYNPNTGGVLGLQSASESTFEPLTDESGYRDHGNRPLNGDYYEDDDPYYQEGVFSSQGYPPDDKYGPEPATCPMNRPRSRGAGSRGPSRTVSGSKVSRGELYSMTGRSFPAGSHTANNSSGASRRQTGPSQEPEAFPGASNGYFNNSAYPVPPNMPYPWVPSPYPYPQYPYPFPYNGYPNNNSNSAYPYTGRPPSQTRDRTPSGHPGRGPALVEDEFSELVGPATKGHLRRRGQGRHRPEFSKVDHLKFEGVGPEFEESDRRLQQGDDSSDPDDDSAERALIVDDGYESTNRFSESDAGDRHRVPLQHQPYPEQASRPHDAHRKKASKRDRVSPLSKAQHQRSDSTGSRTHKQLPEPDYEEPPSFQEQGDSSSQDSDEDELRDVDERDARHGRRQDSHKLFQQQADERTSPAKLQRRGDLTTHGFHPHLPASQKTLITSGREDMPIIKVTPRQIRQNSSTATKKVRGILKKSGAGGNYNRSALTLNRSALTMPSVTKLWVSGSGKVEGRRKSAKYHRIDSNGDSD